MDIEEAQAEPVLYSKRSIFFMILFSGLAIGSDAYNSALMGQLLLLLTVLYPDTLDIGTQSQLTNAFIIGLIIGMLAFGFLSDRLGRKSGAVLTTLFLSIGIIMTAVSHGVTQKGMFWMLTISRGIAGFGAGGEYPVSGAGTAESTDDSARARKHRGFIFAMVADVSASLGFIFSGLVPLLLLLCFHQKEEHYEKVWRISFALGIIPPVSIFWFRYRMAMSSAERRNSSRKRMMPFHVAVRRYWRPLLGSAGAWFLYNYVAYPFGLFSSTISASVNAGDSLVKSYGWGTLITCFYLPGGFIGGYLSDKIGRRKTMALGFGLQAALGFIMGGALPWIQNYTGLFIVLYGLFLTLGEVGPGATIVATSSEFFPTSIRGQMLGLCAAISKAGAAIGTSVFKPILASYGDDVVRGNQAVFLIGSGFSVLGMLVAWFLIPANPPNLVEEDANWRTYLADRGYEIEWGDSDAKDPAKVTFDAVRDKVVD
ncbi:MFS general substrate transporter [Aaosphaeria arxii CBS 175.79]|uniref:MFS general substrate transporter n=1 Tax=Aaosphaeria arxii CBS 175.79 TaxID=1450172 RepID=A0A6A5XIX8_9PLEO|nr:MFS general substrate transporter [Aaosphaeria arxii CBS 175.79]KAF2012787.1 MFS general substrate transporter [Aaosphaeria arxii CBS 175.79]